MSTKGFGFIPKPFSHCICCSKDKKIPHPQVKPEKLYVSPDGTTVRENDGWHEAKAACIYWENERLERVKRYVARFDNSEKFGQYMWLEACKCGFEGQFTKWRMGAIMGREAFGGLKIHLQTTDAPYSHRWPDYLC